MAGTRNSVQLTALSILLAACAGPDEPPAAEIRKDPVVVFAAFEDDTALRELMAAYTEASGVRVIVRRGKAEEIVNDLIENRITPAADVLMTRSAVDVWRAAEEGALRRIDSEAMTTRLPVWARDPENLWASTGFRTAVMAYDKNAIAVDDSIDYEAISEPRFANSLCLSSSGNSVNQTVISMLIHEMGVRDTQAFIRGWIKNLAIPVLSSDGEVLAAISEGRCKLGLVSSDTQVPEELAVHSPAGAFADIDGIGIARHARNPAGALALLDWMINRLDARHFPASRNVSQNNTSWLGWHRQETILLAERVNYD